ncbi:hypothetical protein BH09BAC1_BH09BAC1_26130 [soil metagenome]
MKRFFLLILCSIFFLGAFAQDSTSTKDKVKEKVAQTGSRDRIVVEVGFDNWHQSDGKVTDVKWFSRSYGFYFMYDLLLGKSRFSFAPGVGFGVSNVFTSKGLVEDSVGTRFATHLEASGVNDEDVKKHKLVTNFVDIPLELRFRSKPNKHNKSFKLAVGFKGGVLFDSHTKLKFDSDSRDKPRVIKVKNFIDLNRFRYGPTFRVGYGAFNVFGFYNLASLFKDEGPSGIHPFTVGISINGL